MPKQPAKQPAELWTYAQIADLTGITAGTLRVWRARGKLPTPDYVVGEWPAWNEATVRDWWRTRESLEDVEPGSGE